MRKTIQAIRGMHDALPDQTPRWQFVENKVRSLAQSYGYAEIRMPIVEPTELFTRSIGEVTDIVEKEMYTFQDRNGDSLTLRPEGTASCLRAALQHGMLHNQTQRLWYQGPMFRHERPQKGRYRQFHQIGVEAYGIPGPDIDIELIMLSARLWRELGIDGLELQLNSLGSAAERSAYRTALVNYFSDHPDQLDEESQRRLRTNPLRILDSKNPEMASLIANAPVLTDYLQTESQTHLATLCETLDKAGIAYTLNPRLVRGLDYYCRTVFEWVTDLLGAQGTVCAGGRYDGLVSQIGGRDTPGIGFAMGIERLLEVLDAKQQNITPPTVHAYLILPGERTVAAGLTFAEKLRDALPGLALQAHCGGGGLKSQFKKADRSGAHLALILGEDELAENSISIKNLREEIDQTTLKLDALPAYLADTFNLEQA